MIYKFENDFSVLEVELFNEENQSQELLDNVLISIKNKDEVWYSIPLIKKDVYHLIGALHLLHKEMK